MTALGNDRWRGEFVVDAIGRYRYTVTAWVDPFLSWRHDFARRVDPEDLHVAAQVGAELIDAAAQRATGDDRAQLRRWAARLREATGCRVRCTPSRSTRRWRPSPTRHPDRSAATTFPAELPLVVDRERGALRRLVRAVPALVRRRSRARTARCAIARRACPYVAQMGFDVLYLPPIHPIGRERRKGRNNALAHRCPTTSAARGRSAPPRAATRRCTRSSARSTTSGG